MIDNKFRLISYLGKGGSSKVFLAKDELGFNCAIKIIRKDKNYPVDVADNMLKREHKMLSSLKSHPNIIKSYGINLDGVATMDDDCERIKYHVLEFAESGPLSNFIRYTGPLEESISYIHIQQLLCAIEHMHLNGFAHLDIKLENILLDEFFNAKLADMGTSICVKDSNGVTNKKRGTTFYMAPEVSNYKPGDVYDAYKADIYSLGVAIFVMLVGEFPSPSDFAINCVTDDSNDTSASKSECCSVSRKVKLRWKQLSKEIQELICSMMHFDPIQRPSISSIISSLCCLMDSSVEINHEVYTEMYYRKKAMTKIFSQEN